MTGNSLNIDTGANTGLSVFIPTQKRVFCTTLNLDKKCGYKVEHKSDNKQEKRRLKMNRHSINLSSYLERIINIFNIERINVEKIDFKINGHSIDPIRFHGFYMGIIYSTAMKADKNIFINEIGVSTVRKKSIGSTNISKENIVRWVNKKMNLDLNIDKDHDCADSVLVHIAGDGDLSPTCVHFKNPDCLFTDL